MKNILILLIVCVAVPVLAQSNYVFEVNFDTDKSNCSFGPVTTNQPPMVALRNNKNKITGFRYYVFVTKAQYNAPFSALPAQTVADAKDYASEWYDDYDGWGGKFDSIVEAFREMHNDLAVAAGQPAQTVNKGKMKQKIKGKKPKKNK